MRYIDDYIKSVFDKSNELLRDFFATDKTIFIDGKKCIFNCWIEAFGEAKIFVVEVKCKRFFVVNSAYSMGGLIAENNRKIISQSEMWSMGF